jgi:SAM-dependent methyltransferase
MNPIEIAAAGAAFTAADQTGLLHALKQPLTGDEAAAALKLDRSAVDTVLEILRTFGIVELLEPARYVAGPALLFALKNPLAASPGYWATLFGHTETYLKTGAAREPNTSSSGERGSVYARVTAYLAELFSDRADELAQAIAPLLPGQRILDIGAGSAVWSLAQLARTPDTTLTVFDLEPVLPTALARSQNLGLASRTSCRAGDYRADPLPEGPFHRVILANVLHLEAPEAARRLIQTAAAVTAPDGELVIVDALPPTIDTAESARMHRAYTLYLCLRIQNARVHPEPELRAWLMEAGLERITRVDPETAPGPAALLARRA